MASTKRRRLSCSKWPMLETISRLVTTIYFDLIIHFSELGGTRTDRHWIADRGEFQEGDWLLSGGLHLTTNGDSGLRLGAAFQDAQNEGKGGWETAEVCNEDSASASLIMKAFWLIRHARMHKNRRESRANVITSQLAFIISIPFSARSVSTA